MISEWGEENSILHEEVGRSKIPCTKKEVYNWTKAENKRCTKKKIKQWKN